LEARSPKFRGATVVVVVDAAYRPDRVPGVVVTVIVVTVVVVEAVCHPDWFHCVVVIVVTVLTVNLFHRLFGWSGGGYYLQPSS